MGLETLGALCALGSAATWAVTSQMVRSLTPPFSPIGVNAVRTSLSGVALLAGAIFWDPVGLVTIEPADLALLAVSIVAAIAVGDTFFFESTRVLGLGRAMTVSMSYPVMAAVFAAVFLHEPVTVPIAAGTLLTLGGLMLIVVQRAGAAASRPWRGLAWATIAAVGWAVSVVVVRVPLREVDPWIAQAVRLPIAAAVLWCVPLTRGSVATLRSAPGPLRSRIAVLSVLTAISSVMFVASIKYVGVVVGSVLSSTAPLFAIALERLWLGERLSALSVAGAALTVIGVIVLRM